MTSFTDKHAAIALVLLTLAAFGPWIDNAFVALDDNYLIYANPAVQHITLGSVAHVFSTYDPQLYIPLTFLSWQINAAVFGINATAFHLVNLLLHCGNVVLVLLLLRRLGGNLFVAGVTAALFAIHPLQTEAVLWAAGRKDVLSGFFALLSMLLYLRYRDDERGRTLFWSVLCFALALLSKVSVVLLPGIFLLVDWLSDGRMRRRQILGKMPYGILSALFLAVAVVGKSRLLAQSGGIVNILLPFRSTLFYLEKVFAPTGLSVIYPYRPSGSLLADFGAPVIVATLLGIVTLFLIVKRRRSWALAAGMFFLFLAPSYSTYFKNGFLYFASDRYVYLALIGAFWAAGFSSEKLEEFTRSISDKKNAFFS